VRLSPLPSGELGGARFADQLEASGTSAAFSSARFAVRSSRIVNRFHAIVSAPTKVCLFIIATAKAMSIYDLLFLALFLGAIAALIAAGVAAVRGNRAGSLVALRRLGLSALAYLGVVAIVSLASPRRFVAIGDEQCSDDWCLVVTGVQRSQVSAGVSYKVAFRILSRARRVTQREQGVVVYLRDGRGQRYDPDPRIAGLPFDARLEPLQQVSTVRDFVVPTAASDVGLVVAREGGIPFPRCCIIGDAGSLLHKSAVVRLTQVSGGS
jgi:hypothetical protein